VQREEQPGEQLAGSNLGQLDEKPGVQLEGSNLGQLEEQPGEQLEGSNLVQLEEQLEGSSLVQLEEQPGGQLEEFLASLVQLEGFLVSSLKSGHWYSRSLSQCLWSKPHPSSLQRSLAVNISHHLDRKYSEDIAHCHCSQELLKALGHCMVLYHQ
jgi:hypothetical protein